MRALVVTPGQERSARVTTLADPIPWRDELLVRGVRIGVCRTDHEINAGLYGEAPEGSAVLILGHESIGQVARGNADFPDGTYVVGIVRHPDACPNCLRGEADMCLWGGYREHGIRRLHGFGAEWWVHAADLLIAVPAALADVAVLLEPTSVVEKAMRQAFAAQRRMLWEPKRALVAGAGPIGILGALLLRLRGLDVTLFERTEKPDRSALLARAGVAYRATSVTPLEEIAAGQVDLAIEATGSAAVAFSLVERIGANGVLALTSVSGGDDTAVLPIARINREIVLGNKLVFGSVNANRLDYEAGVRDLGELERRYPGLLASLITRRVPLADAASVIAHDPAQIKVVVEIP